MKTTILRLGFWSALLTAILTAGTFIIAFLTPPPAGPYCTAATCYQYPYLDIASRFPRDYYWMYPAMIWVFSYFILMVTLHYFAPDEKKIISHIGLFMAFLATGLLLTDYFLQISVIQPSLLNGEADGVSMLSQFNPHGVFIVLEELGYLLISVASLFMAFIFSKKNKLESAIRWIFVINFVLSIIALAAYTYFYGINREYRYEVAVISIDWFTLIINGTLLAIFFRRLLKNPS